jgi:hypothetical protein
VPRIRIMIRGVCFRPNIKVRIRSNLKVLIRSNRTQYNDAINTNNIARRQGLCFRSNRLSRIRPNRIRPNKIRPNKV